MIALGLVGLLAAYIAIYSGFKGTNPKDEIVAAFTGTPAVKTLEADPTSGVVNDVPPVIPPGSTGAKKPVGPMGYAIGCDPSCHRSKNAGRYDNWESNNAYDITPVPNLGTGTPVHAPADGSITVSGWNTAGGWRLHIATPFDEIYLAHFAGYAPGIGYGRRVTKGQLIAYMGSTGDSGSPHVHISSRNNNASLYLDSVF